MCKMTGHNTNIRFGAVILYPGRQQCAHWALSTGGAEKSGQHPMSNLEDDKRGSGLQNLFLWICEEKTHVCTAATLSKITIAPGPKGNVHLRAFSH